MNVTLDQEMKERVERAAQKQIVAEVLEGKRETLELLTPAQVAGMLDVTPRTLAEMPIPRVDLAGNGRVLRYRLSDVTVYVESQVIK